MLVTAVDVRNAVQATIQANLPAVLADLADRTGLGLPEPATYRRLADYRDLDVNLSPACLVTVNGYGQSPDQAEPLEWQPVWLTRTFVVVRGRSWEDTADRCAALVAGVRGALFTDPTLGGLAVAARRLGEAYTDHTGPDRVVASGHVDVAFTVPDDVPGTLTTIQAAYGDTSLLSRHPAL